MDEGSGAMGVDEAAGSGMKAVMLEAAPAVSGRDSAQVVASRPLGHLRCANVDEAEVAAISRLLLLALAEAVVEKRKGDMFPRPVETVAETARKELCTFLDNHGTGGGAGGGRSAKHGSQGGTPSRTPEAAASGAPGGVVGGSPFALPAASLALSPSQPASLALSPSHHGNQPVIRNVPELVQGAEHTAGEGRSPENGSAVGSSTADAPSSRSPVETPGPNDRSVGSAESEKGSEVQAVQTLAGPERATAGQTLASSPLKPQPPSGVPIKEPQWQEGEWVPPPLKVAPQVRYRSAH